MLKSLSILAPILILLAPLWGSSQGKKVDQYFQEDGLPNDLIKAVEFDGDGFLWVATDDGVVKMFGSTMVPLITPSKVSSNFKSLLYTQKYGMLCTADGGVLACNKESNELHADLIHNLYEFDNWPQMIFPKTIFESKDSSIWISDLERVYHVVNNKVVTYSFSEKNFTDHYSRSYQFVELNNEFLVISQRGFIYRFDKKTNEFKAIKWEAEGVSVSAVLAIINNRFFIGSDLGLYEIGINKNKTSCSSIHSFPDLSISSLKIKSNNKLVIGTWGQGAYSVMLDADETQMIQVAGTKDDVINDIAICCNDQNWFATDFGLRFVRNVPFNAAFHNVTKEYIQDVLMINSKAFYFSDGYTVYYYNEGKGLKEFYKSANGMVLKLAQYKGNIAMSTNNGKILIKSKKGELKEYDFSNKGRGIYSLSCDWQNNLWFIQDRGHQALVKWNPKNGEEQIKGFGLDGIQARMTKVSPYGEVFVGAYGAKNHLFCYNPLLNKMENLSNTLVEKANTPFSIIDIAFGKFGKIFLATEYGVWVWNEKEMIQLDLGKFTNEMVTGIVIDSRGGLWIANSNGLIWYKNKQYKIFNNNSGLPSKSIPFRTLKIDSNDRFVLGTISGLAKGELVDSEMLTPRPVVSNLKVSGKPINHKTVNRFLNDEILSFRFAAPSYPAKLTYYSYCFNEEDGWTNLKLGENQLTLSGLAPGNYELKLRARSVGFYDWSLVSDYTFSVYKIWYKRTWVVISLYFMAFIIVLLYVLNIIRKNKRIKVKLEKIIDERTGSLIQKNEELVTLNEELNKANIKAEEAVRSKDKFFSVLAHDLKSPFNALIGISELLSQENGSLPKETTEKLIKEIYNTSESTYKLLQNLLDWARSQTGNLKVNTTKVALHEIVSDNISMLELNAKQKQVFIKNEINDDCFVRADMVMLSTVLRNLISNAIKFSENENDIIVEAKEEMDFIKICVVDFGIGIPKEQLNTLFNVGEAKSTPGTANESGTGLGLMLCHEYVLKMGGRIQVNSQLSKGSEFIVYLPSFKKESD